MDAGERIEELGADRLGALLDAVLTVNADLDLPSVLRRIAEVASTLVDARYAALGVLDENRSSLSQFITVGIPDEMIAKIGALPKGHGILGLLIANPEPLRLPDLSRHPDSYGFPPNHPPMKSFLGVPIRSRDQIFGNLYLADKQSSDEFTDEDVRVVVALATAAALAIDNARLHARIRTMTLAEDRERIARDLHDTVIQRLFAAGLSLQTTARLSEQSDVTNRIMQSVDELDDIIRDIRSAIFGLEGGYRGNTSLRSQVVTLVDESTRILGFSPHLHLDGPIDSSVPDRLCEHVLPVLRETITNAARHSGATWLQVAVVVRGDTLELRVEDDGKGFATRNKGGRGLRDLHDRAQAAGGSFRLEPRQPRGSIASWTVPLRRD